MCRELMEQNTALAKEQSGIFYLAARPLLSWVQAESGDIEEAIAGIRSCMAEFQILGNILGSSWYLLLLAEFYAKAGQCEAAIGAVDEALAFAERHEERWREADIHRLKGALLLRQQPGNEAEAERCLLRAVEVARKQEAKWFELRAAVRLGRLWQSQDRRKEAHKLVTGIYRWFTEGFDAVDLQEARSLILELESV